MGHPGAHELPLPRGPSDVTSTGGSGDVVWRPATRDPEREARELETAIRSVLARNRRLVDGRITVVAGAEGAVRLTGWVPTQELRREVELACWTVDGVRTVHDDLVVGRGVTGTRRRS